MFAFLCIHTYITFETSTSYIFSSKKLTEKNTYVAFEFYLSI